MAEVLYSNTQKVYRVDSTSKYWTFRFRVLLNSQDLTNNTSNITIDVAFKYYTSGGTIWSGVSTANQAKTAITHSGITETAVKAGASYVGSTSYKTLATWTGNVAHNNDGSMTIPVSYVFTAISSASGAHNYSPRTNNMSASVQLPTIPRGATIAASATSVVCNSSSQTGDSLTITVTPSEIVGATYVCERKINEGEFETITLTDNAITYSPVQLIAMVGQNTTGTLNHRVTTYVNGEQLGNPNSVEVAVITNEIPFSLYQGDDGIGVGFGTQATSAGWAMALQMNTDKPFMKVKTQQLFDNKTISASGTASDYVAPVPDEKYGLFAIVGYRITNASSSGANSTNVGITQLAVRNDQIRYYLYNRSSSASAKIQMEVDYIEVYTG